MAVEANRANEQVEKPLPPAGVEKVGEAEFAILIERMKIDEFYDQSRELQMGQGCISNPDGPGC